MMTPAQLKQYEFKTAGRNAYKADDVDSFFAEVLISYEKIYRENGELIKRMSLLADRLEKFKNEETDIKQVVMSAQKAADMITKDAEAMASQTKEEAENILAAAKGEAAIIKSDAEKQAIADSELLLSMARDKAEEIMKKAKEKAHGILIAANDSASNTVGAANRTITSESIHYDMLKKEVSEFRASILAQYKAHIELISKLPELAVEEASKIDIPTPPVADVSVENLENKIEDEVVGAPEDSIIEFSENDDSAIENVAENGIEDDLSADDVEVSAEISTIDTVLDFDSNEAAEEVSVAADIPISKKFTINTDDLTFDGFDDEDETKDEVAEDEALDNDFDSAEDAVEDLTEDDIDADDDLQEISDENTDDEDVFSENSEASVDVESDESDGPDVVLSFDDVSENNDIEEETSDYTSDLTLEGFSDSDDSVDEIPVADTISDENDYEDVYSNSDTEQFDDIILTFDESENKNLTEVENDIKPDYNSDFNVEDSAQSRRSRYAKMFGDDYDDEEEDEDDSISSFFGSIETIDVDESDDDKFEKKRKTGFFRRKK